MKLVIGIIKKNLDFVSFSIKNLIKRIFRWAHKKLIEWEKYLLKKIDKWTKNLGEKLEKHAEKITGISGSLRPPTSSISSLKPPTNPMDKRF